MLQLGPRGDFVTRTWQPVEAPDETAVEALMLGPLDAAALANIAARETARPPEDDGLLVRQRPRARADNIARRKQRAAQEANAEDWFDPDDGGLRCLADPVPPGSDRARPARWFDPEAPYLQLKPGSEYEADADALAALADGAGGDSVHRLEVRVGRLEFAAHPLMGREDHLAARLEEAFRSYKRIQGMVDRGEASWARLGAEEREEMAEVVAMWTEAAAQGHVGAQCFLGLMYDEGQGVERDVDRAIELYTQAGTAEAMYNLGLLLQSERQDVDGAEASYRAAIAADPKYADPHSNLGVLLSNKRQDVDGAEAAFRAAIAADPGYAIAHFNLGILLENKRHDVDGAEAAYRAAIAADPGCAIAHTRLGVLLETKRA